MPFHIVFHFFRPSFSVFLSYFYYCRVIATDIISNLTFCPFVLFGSFQLRPWKPHSKYFPLCASFCTIKNAFCSQIQYLHSFKGMGCSCVHPSILSCTFRPTNPSSGHHLQPNQAGRNSNKRAVKATKESQAVHL